MIIKKPLIFIIALSLVVSLFLAVPHPAMATPGECPEGYSMVAYYDWDYPDSYTLVPEDYLDIITFSDLSWSSDGDLQGGTWEVKPPPSPQIPIYVVVITDGDNIPSSYTYYLPDGSLGPETFSNAGIQNRGISNIAFCTPQYPVTLASFTAKVSSDTVSIGWVTATEIETAGFMLYRSTSPDGPRVQVNTSLLAARGDGVTGASYRFTDSPGYGNFYYWLEDVDYSGASSLHGPAYVNMLPAIRRPIYRPSLPGK